MAPSAAVAVVVFSRDLRIRDHPALHAAVRTGRTVPLFVVSEALVRRLGVSANRFQYLADSLADLDAALRRRGGALVVRRGAWVDEVARVARETGAESVHLSDDVSHLAGRRRAALRAAAERDGFTVVGHPGVTVVDPGLLRTGSGTAYQMFTPYYRRWREAPWRAPLPAPSSVTLPDGLDTGHLPSLGDLTTAAPSPEVAPGGETVALARLRAWTRAGLARYPQTHDAVADDATSRISADLHFGCLSPLEVATRLRDRPGGAAFTRQLCWRDFFHQLLAARPELAWDSLRPRGTPAGTDDDAFAAWKAGRTGYPLVDAGMRQLQREGFVHNRVRMVVASFLTKDLDVPWQLGARHFMDVLVDADVANNQLNWQWVAGTGTDGNPHRVFNPIRQSERFDPEGTYIRRYVGELERVAAPAVHDPSDAERTRVGYPAKIVDHRDAVAAYRARLGDSGPGASRKRKGSPAPR